MNEHEGLNHALGEAPTRSGAVWRPWIWWALLPALLILLAFWVSGIGQVRISYGTIARLWVAPVHPQAATNVDDTLRYIVVHVRLARICLALLVGAALALAGVVYQGVLLNPLADPFTLGVSSGAAFAAALAILLGWGSLPLLRDQRSAGLVAFWGAAGALFGLSAGKVGRAGSSHHPGAGRYHCVHLPVRLDQPA